MESVQATARQEIPGRAGHIPDFRWYPVVSFVNVGLDLPMAATVPPGYGHTFTPENYIDGRIAATDPDNWSARDTEWLKSHCADFVASPI